MAISLGSTVLLTIPSAYLLSRTELAHLGIWTALLLHNIVTLAATAYWMSKGKWLRR